MMALMGVRGSSHMSRQRRPNTGTLRGKGGVKALRVGSGCGAITHVTVDTGAHRQSPTARVQSYCAPDATTLQCDRPLATCYKCHTAGRAA